MGSLPGERCSQSLGKLQELGGRAAYNEDCDIARAVPADDKSPSSVRPYAIDKAAAEALWELSEKLTQMQLKLRPDSQGLTGRPRAFSSWAQKNIPERGRF
jgi:hypothetical protein